MSVDGSSPRINDVLRVAAVVAVVALLVLLGLAVTDSPGDRPLNGRAGERSLDRYEAVQGVHVSGRLTPDTATLTVGGDETQGGGRLTQRGSLISGELAGQRIRVRGTGP